MPLPIRTTIDDTQKLCKYFSSKPTGATIAEAKSVLDSKAVDSRKTSALKFWKLLDETENGKLKLTTNGRKFVKGEKQQKEILRGVIKNIAPYFSVIERAVHRNEDSLNTVDVGAHWHEHYKAEAGDNDTTLNDSAVCFFRIAEGAGLGKLINGRKGAATRISFDLDEANKFISNEANITDAHPEANQLDQTLSDVDETEQNSSSPLNGSEDSNKQNDQQNLGQAIFIAHGKNKKPLEQLKKILDQFKIQYRVVVDEPNLGRPISKKVKEVMHECNCAIMIFTSDEEFKDKDGKTVWRPSENVVYELGATGYLYDNRIVILKESDVRFPSNFNDLGYISFEKDNLHNKSMDVLKELIGFGIVKITT